MSEEKKNVAERFLNFTGSLQRRAHRRQPGETIYGDITNRMFAVMLDLIILLLPMYLATNLALMLFFHNTEQLLVTVQKVKNSIPAEDFARLQNNFFAMFSYISQKYPADASTIIRQLVFIRAFQLLVIGLYIIPFVWKCGATPGKMVVGLRVVDSITKDKISLSQSIIRYLSYITFPLGMPSGALRKDRRCWHDFIADTMVIYSPNRWYKRHYDAIKLRIRKFFNLPV